MANNHRSGKNPPYGYQIANKKLLIDPDEEPIVREVFELYHKYGWGNLKIANHLTQKGYPTRLKRKEWDYTTVQGMIKNTLYKGVQIYKEEVGMVDGKKVYETHTISREELKIIDPVVFDACQDRIHKNKNYTKSNQKHTFLFDKRIMKCGICQKHLIARASKKMKNTKGYYMCYQNKHGNKCANKPVNITSFEEYLPKYLYDNWKDLVKKNDGKKRNKEKVNAEIALLKSNRLVMYMPFSAWYDSGFTRGLLLPFFR